MQKAILILTFGLFLQFGVSKMQAAGNVSVDFFYDQLGDYGDWSEVGDYGYCWQPRDVDEDWRPYSDGRWAHTEAGWTWLSEEPYGWAVYHYGRWARLEGRGWVWIPGTEWAPAWVSWRRSPQHVGWAPLPPEASFRRSVGFSGWVDSYYDIGPSAYRFVEVRNFGAPRLRTVFVEPRENITIIRQTTNITRITYVNSTVYNEGPRYEDISRESAEPIRRLKLDRRVEIEGDRSSFRGEQMRSRVEGDSLRVFAPGIDARTEAPPRKLAAKIEKVEVNRGWKDAGPAADVEKLRTKVRGEAKAPKGLPPKPKFEKLAEQTISPEFQPAKENPAQPAPGGKPASKELKAGGKSKDLPAPPTVPLTAPKGAPSEKSGTSEAPTTPKQAGKAGKKEKVAESEIPGRPRTPPGKTQEKPDKAVPPAADTANPEPKGKKGKPAERPLPTPVVPVKPKVKKESPEAAGEAPPAPQGSPKNGGRSLQPEPGAPRTTSEPLNKEPKKTKAERPQPTREAPPATEKTKPTEERKNPPNVAPAKAPEPAPQTAKGKPAKGKAKDEKKPEDEVPKPK